MDASRKEVLLEVDNLKTYFYLRRGVVRAVNGVSFKIYKNEIMGIVGESGCGKSITGLSILRLIPNPPGEIVDGKIYFDGEELLSKSEKEMRKIRGKKISMIQQSPDTSLNPVFRIGNQIAESIVVHRKVDKVQLKAMVIKLLEGVRIPNPEVKMNEFPHMMSGGQRQRVAGAVALACKPKLLIADEPTTNLDVTLQEEYLRLLKEVQEETGVSILFITHDFGVVNRVCDRLAVMYAGKIVEVGTCKDVMRNPLHPYTKGLLGSIPNMNSKGSRLPYIKGSPPDPLSITGDCCSFAERCFKVDDPCRNSYPDIIEVSKSHSVRCFHAIE